MIIMENLVEMVLGMLGLGWFRCLLSCPAGKLNSKESPVGLWFCRMIFSFLQLFLRCCGSISSLLSSPRTWIKKWYFVMISMAKERAEIQHIPSCRAWGALQKQYPSPQRTSQETWKEAFFTFWVPDSKVDLQQISAIKPGLGRLNSSNSKESLELQLLCLDPVDRSSGRP